MAESCTPARSLDEPGHIRERRPTIADVPGLIEGASRGAGLGHAFLRYVERTRILIHVVDGTSRDPESDYAVIREELASHDPALLEKPMIVAFNKLAELLPSAAELAAPPEPAGVVVHRFDSIGDGFLVERDEDHSFRVRGRRIERIAAQTDFAVDESAERFQRDLARLGIDAELRRAGIRPGDLVRIGAAELEWEPEPRS